MAGSTKASRRPAAAGSGPLLALAVAGVLASAAAASAQSAAAGAGTLELTYGRGGSYANPQPPIIVGVLEQLRNRQDDFAVLDRGQSRYMQTIGGPDTFRLEYRDGSADRHYGCVASKDQVVAAFLSYASGADEAWRSVCGWVRLKP